MWTLPGGWSRAWQLIVAADLVRGEWAHRPSPSGLKRSIPNLPPSHGSSIPNVVEQDMDQHWRDELAIIKAQLAVQQMAIRALADNCPEPVALLESWRKLRAETVAAAYALLPETRHSEWLTDRVHAFAEDWTAELVDIVTRRAGHAGESSEGSGAIA
jgi:hypothetical protein